LKRSQFIVASVLYLQTRDANVKLKKMLDFLTLYFGPNRAESIVWEEATLWYKIHQCLQRFGCCLWKRCHETFRI